MLDTPFLDIVPLGGLGEFGMNCLGLDCPEGTLLVDCGTTFSSDDLGVDLLHPDFSWLQQAEGRLKGVFLTHAHEDHIGGLPYLLRHFPVPLWGSGHTLALVERRLLEHGFDRNRLVFHETVAGAQYEVGPFRVEPIRVSHSIAEATALAVTHAAGTIVHSGDFNFDPFPCDGEPTDTVRLAELGQRGVDLLMSDSTNVDSHDEPTSEQDVALALDELVEQAAQRLVVCLFASNIQRLITLGKLAEKYQRKICLLGRSLSLHIDIARRRGLLRWPDDLVLPRAHAEDCPPRQLLALAGGTQAEANSAMQRLAQGENDFLKLSPGDTVLFSSRIIPGKEPQFSRMHDALLRQDVIVHTRVTTPRLHTSGHAHRSEQRRLIELLRPKAFMPLHGTLHHLRRHAELARQVGVPTVVTTESGHPLRYQSGDLMRLSAVPTGRVAIGANRVVLGEQVLRERAELGRRGIALVTIHLTARHTLQGTPSVTAVGVPLLETDSAATERVVAELTAWIEANQKPLSDPTLDVDSLLRRRIARMVERATGTRPRVEVHLERD